MAETGDWPIDLFEANAHQVIDLIKDYFSDIRSWPVTPSIEPAELLAALDGPVPEGGEPFEEILSDTRGKIMPNLAHWNHPSFHAYVSISASFPGILADTMISALNVNAMVWRSAPAASTLETVVLRWIAEMVGIDPTADSVLINGASLGTCYALAAARGVVPGLDVRRQGLTAPGTPTMRVYTSGQSHSSVDKAVITLGLGLDNLVKVPVDDRYRMRPDALDQLMTADEAAGYRPIAVSATVGTTSTGASDPVSEVARVCRAHNAWLHVDAAYGGFWNVVPEVRSHAEDLSLADSVVINPHKCMYAPLEVTCLYSPRKGALASAFRLVPEYLRTDEAAAEHDYMNYTLQLGREFRALKLWWIIRSFGRAGIEDRLRESLRIAAVLREEIQRHPDFECIGSSLFPLVCLRYVPRRLRAEWETATPDRRAEIQRETDELNAELLKRLNETGSAYASHGVVKEGYVIRISIGNIRTEESDIRRLWTTLTRLTSSPEAAAS